MSRACWLDIVKYVHARVAVRDLFGRLAQELSLPGVTADLVDDVDQRTLRPRTGGLDCNAVSPPVASQDWSQWGVLVLDHLLDNAMRHALKLIHQAF